MEASRPKEIKTKTKDGTPLAVGHIPIPEKMFFFERPDGSVINLSEKDAAKLYGKFKYVGQTDGNDYMNTLKELQGKFQELTMEEIQSRMRDAMKAEIEKSKANTTPPVLEPLSMGMREQIFGKFKDTTQSR